MLDKGILLVAYGHPFYARLAHNLLASLKYHNKDLDVAICVAKEGFGLLLDSEKDRFDIIIDIPEEYYTDETGSIDPYKIKLHLDQLTPFKKTLFLDVDMIWNNFKKPLDLIDSLNGNEFKIICRDKISCSSDNLKSAWVNLKEVKDKYGIENVYDISSELIYFEHNTTIFNLARKVYNEKLINVSKFGIGTPDEVYIMIAMALNNIEYDSNSWEPTYWEPRHYPRQHSREYISNSYAMSIGGAFVSNHIKNIYESLCKHYFYSLGIGTPPFQLINKSRVFNERRKI
jgi:hypothetical protein